MIDDGSSDGTRELVRAGWSRVRSDSLRVSGEPGQGGVREQGRGARPWNVFGGVGLGRLVCAERVETFTRRGRRARRRSGTGTPGSERWRGSGRQGRRGSLSADVLDTISRSSGRSTACAGTRRLHVHRRRQGLPDRISRGRVAWGVRGAFVLRRIAAQFCCRWHQRGLCPTKEVPARDRVSASSRAVVGPGTSAPAEALPCSNRCQQPSWSLPSRLLSHMPIIFRFLRPACVVRQGSSDISRRLACHGSCGGGAARPDRLRVRRALSCLAASCHAPPVTLMGSSQTRAST